MKASIIIPAYNSGKTIKKCVDSLTNQSYKNKELIVVDSGTDNTKDILKEYKIKFIKEKTRKQASEARNIGAKNAKGDILIFVDSDCIADKDLVKNLIADYTNKDIGSVGGSQISISEGFLGRCTDSLLWNFSPNLKKEEREFVPTSNLSIKKDIFNKINGFDEKITIAEDRDICARIRKSGYKVVFEPKALIYHNNPRINFTKFIKRNFQYGYGTAVKLKNPEISNAKYFPKSVILTALMVPFLAGASTLKFSKNILKHDKSKIIYVPFIALGRLFWAFGCVKGCYIYKKEFVD